ncbi:hypothetical protein Q9L42_009095 [Methylomarinum sp. Ch1-1]|uniref:Oxalate:formate antiporter n=1 Tax=Methylomarinum roseum TaxID=3067653 RepID=A0AAU7NZ97_9GAMM|nr:hypothetical protein [Methylomarinum sp. Ch1-1]MDP4521612.1 hypothetical protein [Methylomarinum sp. Ch1-1]
MNDSTNGKKLNPWLILFWLYVTVPLVWGIWSTLQKALALFN